MIVHQDYLKKAFSLQDVEQNCYAARNLVYATLGKRDSKYWINGPAARVNRLARVSLGPNYLSGTGKKQRRKL